jgi:hypothetical protein
MQKGFVAVLTAGSAATYYAPGAYQSLDLDFVLTFRGSNGEEALTSLGFKRKGDYYVHPVSRFSLDFPPGPLAIGDDLIKTGKRSHEGTRCSTSSRRRTPGAIAWRRPGREWLASPAKKPARVSN